MRDLADRSDPVIGECIHHHSAEMISSIALDVMATNTPSAFSGEVR
ncbi:hypothetical protein GTA09_30145 [Rhodococcus hoagii]|nr:hypothetical protein [Prescottella equi]